MSPEQQSDPALTEADVSTLARAAYLRRRFDAGIFPSTIGQRSHFTKLVRQGLLVLEGWGRDMDGESERDVMIYQLTAAGETALTQAREKARLADG